MNLKEKEMNSQRVRAITAFTTELHNDVAELYEELIDGEDKLASKKSNEIIKKLKDLKFD